MRKSTGTATGTSKKRTGSNIDTSTDSTRIRQAYKIHQIYPSTGGRGGLRPPRPPVLVCMGCILYAWRIRVESVLVSMLLPVRFLLVPVAVPIDFLTVEQGLLNKKDYLNSTLSD